MDIEEKVNEMFEGSDIAQGWGIAKMLLDMRREDKAELERALEAAESAQKSKRITMILCAVAVIACLATGVFLGVLASGVQIDTTTTTETITQDTGEGSGNNVSQAGENATYEQGGGD